MIKTILIVVIIFLIYALGWVIISQSGYNVTNTTKPIVHTPLSADRIFNLVQTFRTQNGLKTYTKSDFLCSIAETRLKETYINFSHEGFEADRFCNSECTIGENLSKNYLSDKQVLDTWIQSPSHKKNLTDPYTHSCIRTDGFNVVHIFGYY